MRSPEPDNWRRRTWVSRLENVGRVLKKGDYAGALELFQESRQIFNDLRVREPDNLAYRRELGIAMYYVGRCYALCQQFTLAKRYLDQSESIIQGLIDAKAAFGSLAEDMKIVSEQNKSVLIAIPLLNPDGKLATELEEELVLAVKNKPLWAKPLHEETVVETIEGRVIATAGSYLCRGIEGELWPQQAAKLLDKYLPTTEYDGDGFQRFDPKPNVQPVEAVSIPHDFRVIAQWGDLVGLADDYLVRSTTDRGDVWIVSKAIFEASYALTQPPPTQPRPNE
ncbi:MAG: hypothetical protein R3C05_28340 [Pirellulaceae bacterium]